MADHDVLLPVLRRFARTMTSSYDITDVLYELCDNVVEVLGADGAGVSVYDEQGDLRFVTATDEAVVGLEKVQEELGAGPCVTAAEQNRLVTIGDTHEPADDDTDEIAAWPDYRQRALELGLRAVLGVPMVLDGDRIGALNVYSKPPRRWTQTNTTEARVLADIAAAYVLNASELARTRRTTEQLQHALDSRVVIEQAKGRLCGDLEIPIDEAFRRMRHHARSHNRTLRDVAADVVERGATALAPVRS